MAPRLTIIGGGSYQWVPKLVVDLANTPALCDAEVVIEDIDPVPIPRMVELVEHIADVRGIGLTARGTTDQREALEGADYVVVNISTGGFESMRPDLEVPARYGIEQSVGDSVGPGGILRALRNIPVFLGIAGDMEAVCPDAWLLNLTNPMTTICRAVTRESSITTVGLCHEITIMQFILSLLLDVGFMDISATVAGVNHLPFITALDVKGEDGFELLRALIDDVDGRGAEPLAMALPDGLVHGAHLGGGQATKADLLESQRLKLEIFRRFGVLPGAGDRHVAEFFSGFLTEESGWGERWGVHLTTIEERERDRDQHIADLEAMLASREVSQMPSGEMVASIIACRINGSPGWFPLNLPNDGQVADLPTGVVVESMCVADGTGMRGRDVVSLPPTMAEHLGRVSASQERTVEAAIRGDRAVLLEAMFLDPLAGRIDDDLLVRMTDEMLGATKPWLPQFA